ncbi:phage tail tube protein [Paenibacillus woosongensis]|uniref:Phage portal protein n=1 Tax=Paenibacillus woosongensis TaxID=307580 RepID=A0A7X3CML0_9BACL|nr:phage tail tube protein [Paenibacillus woosongensis]MUG44277.1 phage portal protein [Paenibacillus woosongensis]GIP59690.1 phage portal protein [Paenibacillus woosongensis]
MGVFNVKDAISGKTARAFVTINGRVEELLYGKTGEATAEKNKVDVPVLGKTNTPQRAAGWKGTGTLTVYYVTSMFRELMINYIKTGEDFWFDLMMVNEQPGSAAGKQTIILKNCNVDSLILSKFDATSDDMLEEEIPFTFEDVDMPDMFNTIQ